MGERQSLHYNKFLCNERTVFPYSRNRGTVWLNTDTPALAGHRRIIQLITPITFDICKLSFRHVPIFCPYSSYIFHFLLAATKQTISAIAVTINTYCSIRHVHFQLKANSVSCFFNQQRNIDSFIDTVVMILLARTPTFFRHPALGTLSSVHITWYWNRNEDTACSSRIFRENLCTCFPSFTIIPLYYCFDCKRGIYENWSSESSTILTFLRALRCIYVTIMRHVERTSKAQAAYNGRILWQQQRNRRQSRATFRPASQPSYFPFIFGKNDTCARAPSMPCAVILKRMFRLYNQRVTLTTAPFMQRFITDSQRGCSFYAERAFSFAEIAAVPEIATSLIYEVSALCCCRVGRR